MRQGFNVELQFDTYGTGVQHAVAWSETVGTVCDRCGGRRTIRAGSLPLTCPTCHGTGKVLQRKESHGEVQGR
jgi:DnaJ-class molecular chaperone